MKEISGRSKMKTMDPIEKDILRIQKKIIKVIIDILKVDVTSRDNFFLFGCDSIKATQFVARISSLMQKNIRLKDIFEYPTVEELSKFIYKAKTISDGKISAIPSGKAHEASFLQEKEYLTYLIKGENIFNLNLVLSFKELNTQALAKAIKVMFKRHEALRTVFSRETVEIKQTVQGYDLNKHGVQFLNLSNDSQFKIKLEKIYGDLANSRFDFENGPLVKIVVAEIPNGISFLLLAIHHAICDASSLDIIKREIGHLYECYKRGQKPTLKKLPLQYKDYSFWNINLLNGQKGTDCREFYLNKISQSLTKEGVLTGKDGFKHDLESYRASIQQELLTWIDKEELPLYSRAIGIIGKLKLSPGGNLTFFYDENRLLLLKQRAYELGSSMFVLLISSICILLFKIEGRQYFRIDSPMTNRMRSEFENIVGWIMGGIIACINLNENVSLKDFIKYITNVVLETAEFRYYSLERIMKDFDLCVDVLAPIQLNFINSSSDLIESFNRNHLSTGFAYYTLACNVFEFKNGLKFSVQYNADFYSHDSIDAMFKQYDQILDKILLDNSSSTIRDLIDLA